MQVVSFDHESVTVNIEFRTKLQSRGKSDLPTVLYFFEGGRGFYGVDNLDLDWKLVATDNATLWIWSLHRQHTVSWSVTAHSCAGFWYPCETFTMRLWIATNSPAFNLTTSVSGYGYELDQRGPRPATTLEAIPNEEVRYEFSKSFVPNRYSVELIARHTLDYKGFIVIVAMFLGSISAILIALILKRRILRNSDFIQVCLGALFFIPVFLLTFRTTIAPAWLTWVDFFLGILAFLWGIILFWRIKNYDRYYQ